MRLSPATRLADRQTVWVSYRNDGSAWNECPEMVYPSGIPATIWAAQFSESHADEVAPCPISGWRSNLNGPGHRYWCNPEAKRISFPA